MFEFKTDCFKIYDTRLINNLGLIPAVVLTEISNLGSVEVGTFPFSYISDTDYTKAIDGLVNLNLLRLEDNGYVVVHDNVCHLLYDETIDCSTIPSTLNIRKSKTSKREAIKTNLLKTLPDDMPEDLVDMYSRWLTVAMNKGLMTKEQFLTNVNILDIACITTTPTGDIYNKSKALEILAQAIACGYTTLQWAITNYDRQHPTGKPVNKPVPNQIQVNKTKTDLSTKGY